MKLSLSYKLVIGCSLILLISLSITFYIINDRQQQLIIRQAENEARAVFQQIVIMRRWIADHGGVFVEQLPWAVEGPLHATSGESRHYTRKTPAMVTRELVSYARESGLYWFHITSLNLTNPENAPDDFERTALQRFEQEPLTEIISMDSLGKTSFLRYISPLYVEDACLGCHQGYDIGDVRGAISVTLPLSKVFAEAAANRNLMFGSMILLVAFLSSTLLFFLRRMVLNPVTRLSNAISRFSENEPPPQPIIRSGDEFEDLSSAFEQMAARLTDYHQGLEEKVRTATAELQQLNEQISRASERKSDFLVRSAHELRTPLTSIKGAMEYITSRMQQQPPTNSSHPDDLLEFFRIVHKNTDRLIRMVNTMLDIEHIEMGADGSLHKQPVAIGELIHESVAAIALDAGKRNITFKVNDQPLPTIQADEDRIRQVLINLLANAVKFSPEQGIITIDMQSDDTWLSISICDEGEGIAKAQREQIFERFVRYGNKEGSGLGLAICRAIIEAHGGTIKALEPASSGACLNFTLPLPPVDR